MDNQTQRNLQNGETFNDYNRDNQKVDGIVYSLTNIGKPRVYRIDTDIEGGRRPQVLQALRDTYGQDRVANVVTFGTEKSKSAIQTAARGLGIDVDEALYIASLIPSDRGITRTLKQCYYGDAENGFEPIPAFVTEMDENPDLWKVAQNIEGLICRIG